MHPPAAEEFSVYSPSQTQPAHMDHEYVAKQALEAVASDYYHIHLDSPKLQYQHLKNLFKTVPTEFSDKVIFAGIRKSNSQDNVWLFVNPTNSEVIFAHNLTGVTAYLSLKKFEDIDLVEPFCHVFHDQFAEHGNIVYDNVMWDKMRALSCFLFVASGLVERLPYYSSFPYWLESACKDVISKRREGGLYRSVDNWGPEIVRETVEKGGYFAVDKVLRPLEKPRFNPRKDWFYSMIRPVRIQKSIQRSEPATMKRNGGINKTSDRSPKLIPSNATMLEDARGYAELQKKLATIEKEQEALKAEKAEADSRAEDAKSKVVALEAINKQKSATLSTVADKLRLLKEQQKTEQQQEQALRELKHMEAQQNIEKERVAALKKVEEAEARAFKASSKLDNYKSNLRMLADDSD